MQKLKSRSLVFTARFFHFVPPLHELYMTKIHLSKWLSPLSNSSSKRLDDCGFGIFSCSVLSLSWDAGWGTKSSYKSSENDSSITCIFYARDWCRSNPAPLRHVPNRAGQPPPLTVHSLPLHRHQLHTLRYCCPVKSSTPNYNTTPLNYFLSFL